MKTLDIEAYAKQYIDDKKKKTYSKFKEEYKAERRNKFGMMAWAEYKETPEFTARLEAMLSEDRRYVVFSNMEAYPEEAEKFYQKYIRETERKAKEIKEMEEHRAEIKDYLFKQFYEAGKKETFKKRLIACMEKKLNNYFSKVHFSYDLFSDVRRITGKTIVDENSIWEDLAPHYRSYIKTVAFGEGWGKPSVFTAARQLISQRKYIKENKDFMEKHSLWKYSDKYISGYMEEILDGLVEKCDFDTFIHIVNTNNRAYKGFLNRYEGYMRKARIISEGISKTIPKNYIDFFPLARKMQRKFIIHSGGTNSGKTYESMQALRKADSGVYLGPLRMLAYEQYDRLNKDGFPCSLKTGEEAMEVPGAKYTASTIEMLNYAQEYDVAVIDEAQMISDPFRGGAWTNAILGVLAHEIHICTAPEALEVIKKIISSCGDECTVVQHERNTPLILEGKCFDFGNGIQKGDALIVFSRKSVHAVANDLEKKHIKCSIIYGALPYDVRQNEANKFAEGITDVVVATDAIGMGMNLPIRRVVFLETSKFDGKEVRSLDIPEIKQIAGRAGRYGIYDKGFVNSYSDKSLIRDGLEQEVPEIKTAFIRFPESLIQIDGSLSQILSQWESMEVKKGFKKADISHERKLCLKAEIYLQDKKAIYDFITIPFDDENWTLMNIWDRMVSAMSQKYTLNPYIEMQGYCGRIESMDLHKLEETYKICDMFFYYDEKFRESADTGYLMEEKKRISGRIIELLDKFELPKRKCRECGKQLAWNFRYNICDKCHRASYSYYDNYRRFY